jgi:DivIVA domain-containing protein
MRSSVILTTVTNETPAGREAKEAAGSTPRFPRSRASAVERARMREDVRDVHFPTAVRGYDRAAVDRYVERVNRLIAELEISSSPESVIRAALEDVSEETRGLLQRAHETADDITARSRARADDRFQQAEREAAEVREAASRDAQELHDTARRETQELRERTAHEAHELTETAAREAQHLRATTAHEAHELTEAAAREAQHLRATAEREVEELRATAEARVRELERDAEAIWLERRRLMENVSEVAQQLLRISSVETGRFPGAVEPRVKESGRAGKPVAEEELAPADEPQAVPPEGAEQT